MENQNGNNETKTVENAQAQANAGSSVPNQTPADDASRKVAELEAQLRERDSKLQEVTTTLQTINSRMDQVQNAYSGTSNVNKVNPLQERTKQILERAAYDPENASSELTKVLQEMQTTTSQEAVAKATQAIKAQTELEKIKLNLKVQNPEFDDEMVDLVMERANVEASTGKYKTADEAIKTASQYIKAKLDSYAEKKFKTNPLPTGALAESGSNPAPSAKVQEKIEEPSEYITKWQDKNQSKRL